MGSSFDALYEESKVKSTFITDKMTLWVTMKGIKAHNESSLLLLLIHTSAKYSKVMLFCFGADFIWYCQTF